MPACHVELTTKNEGGKYLVRLAQNLEMSSAKHTIKYTKIPIPVLFDSETGGFAKICDILKIAAKYKEHEFSVYVKPTQNISEGAS